MFSGQDLVEYGERVLGSEQTTQDLVLTTTTHAVGDLLHCTHNFILSQHNTTGVSILLI